MAASTIPNSGGPGSKVELSAVTIAVRDKVIEKFADQPLDAMNESVKKLLSSEEDEQKRLGILAARVYILRQRILKIADGDPDRVVGSAAPKAENLAPDSFDAPDAESGSSEWTRLRILEDCEVNGVRFPKTVIIDVKTEDAERLIENGKAELIVEDPVPASKADAVDAGETADEPVAAPAEDETAGLDAADVADADTDDTQAAAAPPEETDPGADDLSALSAELEATPEPQMEVEPAPEPEPAEEETAEAEAVIEAPSAAEVTAALEALSNGTEEESADAAATGPAEDLATSTDASDDEAADVAAELEAMSAAFSSQPAEAEAVSEAAGDAEDVSDGGDGGDGDEGDGDKPGGWFQAQQDAEQSARAETDDDSEDNPEHEKS